MPSLLTKGLWVQFLLKSAIKPRDNYWVFIAHCPASKIDLFYLVNDSERWRLLWSALSWLYLLEKTSFNVCNFELVLFYILFYFLLQWSNFLHSKIDSWNSNFTRGSRIMTPRLCLTDVKYSMISAFAMKNETII